MHRGSHLTRPPRSCAICSPYPASACLAWAWAGPWRTGIVNFCMTASQICGWWIPDRKARSSPHSSFLHPPDGAQRQAKKNQGGQQCCQQWRPVVQQADMAKHAVERGESQTGEDAQKHPNADATRARRMKCKWQGQQHHDGGGQRQEQLGPQRNFVTRGFLLVGLQLLNVMTQR